MRDRRCYPDTRCSPEFVLETSAWIHDLFYLKKIHFLSFLLKSSRNNDRPGSHSTLKMQIVVLNSLTTTRNKSFWEKRLVLGTGQEMYKISPEHTVTQEDKDTLNDYRTPRKTPQGPTQSSLPLAKDGTIWMPTKWQGQWIKHIKYVWSHNFITKF